MRCVEFKNTTGLTLEGGPVTVLEGGSYVGEAMLETIKPDEKRLVPYAVELGVTRARQRRFATTSASRRVVIRQGHAQGPVRPGRSRRRTRSTTRAMLPTSSTSTIPAKAATGRSSSPPRPTRSRESYWRFRFDLAPVGGSPVRRPQATPARPASRARPMRPARQLEALDRPALPGRADRAGASPGVRAPQAGRRRRDATSRGWRQSGRTIQDRAGADPREPQVAGRPLVREGAPRAVRADASAPRRIAWRPSARRSPRSRSRREAPPADGRRLWKLSYDGRPRGSTRGRVRRAAPGGGRRRSEEAP